jgi:hypothetical protein
MNNRSKRIRLEKFELDQQPDSGCTSNVVLEWDDGGAYVGTASADDSMRGHLRCSAEAAAQALELASEGTVDLDILAIKAIEGFDTVLVVVALRSDAAKINERLSGSCLIKGTPPRSAAMAVLDATNRLYGYAFQRTQPQLRLLH